MAIKGSVDGMRGVHVIGWAVAEPDRGNCAIEVKTEQGEVVARGRASRHRDDLAALGLGRTTMGFHIAIPSDPARRILHVLANGEELNGSPILVGAGVYDGEGAFTSGVLTGAVTQRAAGMTPPLITVIDQHGSKVGESRATLAPAEANEPAPRAQFTVELDDRCFGAGELLLTALANGARVLAFGCNLSLRGNLELVTPERCTGWLLSPDLLARNFEIEVFRDGVLAGAGTCDMVREDVEAVFPGCGTPGFSITLKKPVHEALDATTISLRLRNSDIELFEGPYVLGSRAAAVAAAQRAARLAYYGLTGVGAAERAIMQLALSEYMAKARRGNGFVSGRQPDPVVPYAEKPRLTIIVPVYKGIEVTRDCLESVLKHRDPATDQLVVINDASPDPIMAPMIAQLNGVPNVFVLTNEQNLGFVQTINRGLRFAGGSDVLLLNSDTVLFAGGLDEICRVAYATAEIGTVTAMSNNATIFTYPHPSLRGDRLADTGWPELAAAALAENAGVAVDVPTGHGFCMFIKAEVLRRVGLLDEIFGRGYGEENDFCARAADLGYRHVAAAGVLVEHRESISFGEERAALVAKNLPLLHGRYPEYQAVIMEFERQDGLRQARWALDRVRLAAAAASGRRFVLLVTTALDGGTAKAVADIDAAAGDPARARITLRCREDGFMELSGEDPAFLATFAPREIAPLFDLIGSIAPGHVLVHQLLGFPAAFIEHLGEWAAGLHSVFFAHDYYSLCPRVTMIDAVGRFCDVADSATCARCVAMDGAHALSKLNALTPAAHRELFDDLLRGFRQVIAPSPSAAAYFGRVFPDVPIEVIAHPEPAADVASGPRTGTNNEIVLIGAIGPHKGSARLLEIAQRARLTHPDLTFRVVGFTDIDRQLLAVGNVIITGRYQPAQLPNLIAQARGRLAIFLHAWPETYSYTLSEAAKYGFVPLVPDIGAPAARVRAAKYGVVFPFPFSAEQVLGVIDHVRTGRMPAFAAGATPSRLFAGGAEVDRLRALLDVPPAPEALPEMAPEPEPRKKAKRKATSG
jgi:GT2 family glycosyltransferase/glycosyltransferase involved in cell wall biosynthesis